MEELDKMYLGVLKQIIEELKCLNIHIEELNETLQSINDQLEHIDTTIDIK